MIALLQQQKESLGLNNIQAERVAAEDIGDLADGSFDTALCSLGLMFMPDSDVGVKSMWQALRSGGSAIAAVWGQRNKNAWADIFPIVDSTVKSEVCPLFFSLGAENSLKHSFEKQGFESVKIRRIETTLDFDSEDDLLGAMIDGGAVALAAKRFDDATRQQVEKKFLDSISEYHIDGRYLIPTEFVVVSGIKTVP
jgi:SAM-dependent methyltransferase